ncbi:hypothetical protein SARC_11590 [Sphaeroforma arctica JP610]|uniref:C2H2-type domain-containing protein n=1 Tax=Sphaeroforma arctica JP610 TaxID=667725 RepID=A0A0L0FGI3_9EUKA|nr:hypothetical protein SARC_11590 [Sphaeroforma arctica JP610]KNC75892.1 hypothetical protein SARC_11590 [Sphaeroforma arctica JP610]|eukprot:XP_014149794.1 hypothetical protein SARC_11590 [Sphaeroforma arctica JP610]
MPMIVTAIKNWHNGHNVRCTYKVPPTPNHSAASDKTAANKRPVEAVNGEVDSAKRIKIEKKVFDDGVNITMVDVAPVFEVKLERPLLGSESADIHAGKGLMGNITQAARLEDCTHINGEGNTAGYGGLAIKREGGGYVKVEPGLGEGESAGSPKLGAPSHGTDGPRGESVPETANDIHDDGMIGRIKSEIVLKRQTAVDSKGSEKDSGSAETDKKVDTSAPLNGGVAGGQAKIVGADMEKSTVSGTEYERNAIEVCSDGGSDNSDNRGSDSGSDSSSASSSSSSSDDDGDVQLDTAVVTMKRKKIGVRIKSGVAKASIKEQAQVNGGSSGSSDSSSSSSSSYSDSDSDFSQLDSNRSGGRGGTGQEAGADSNSDSSSGHASSFEDDSDSDSNDGDSSSDTDSERESGSDAYENIRMAASAKRGRKTRGNQKRSASDDAQSSDDGDLAEMEMEGSAAASGEAGSLDDHANAEGEVYTCFFTGCGQTFASIAYFDVHLTSHTGQVVHVCTYEDCTACFTTAKDLERHTASHQYLTTVVCANTACSEIFGSVEAFQKHWRSFHGRISDAPACKHASCGLVFPTHKKQAFHERDVHLAVGVTSQGLYRCAVLGCKTVKKRIEKRNAHQNMPHSHVCKRKKCGRVFVDAQKLFKHQVGAHDTDLAMVCSYQQCGQTSLTVEDLAEHIRTHYKGLVYCGESGCGSVLASADHEAHLRTSHKLDVFVCSVCDKLYKSYQKYITHQAKRHPTTKATACALLGCAAKLDEGLGLDEHMRISHDSVCLARGCGKRFVHALDLAIHRASQHDLTVIDLDQGTFETPADTKDDRTCTSLSGKSEPSVAHLEPEAKPQSGAKVSPKGAGSETRVEKETLLCPYNGCDQKCSTDNLFRTHIRKHYRRMVYCGVPECNSITLLTDYKRHLGSAHGCVDEFKCSACPKSHTFKIYENLRTHMEKNHGPELKHACALAGCTAQLKTSAGLDAHMRQSHDHVCAEPECGERFVYSSRLATHTASCYTEAVKTHDKATPEIAEKREKVADKLSAKESRKVRKKESPKSSEKESRKASAKNSKKGSGEDTKKGSGKVTSKVDAKAAKLQVDEKASSKQPVTTKVVPFSCFYSGCDKKFTDFVSYKKHVVHHYRRLACCPEPSCREIFLKTDLKQHLYKAHGITDNFVCGSCNKSHKTFEKYITHTARRHGTEKPLACAICGCTSQLARPSKLDSHMHDNHDYICKSKHCKERFVYASRLARHTATHHKKEVVSKRDGSSGSEKARTAQEIPQSESGAMRGTDQTLAVLDRNGDNKLVSMSADGAVVGVASGVPEDATKTKSFACKYTFCRKQMSTLDSFVAHVINHQRVWMLCGQSGCTTAIMKSDCEFHLRLVHGITANFKCGICRSDQTYSTFREYIQHIRKDHHVKDPRACAVSGCPAVIEDLSQLDEHMRTVHDVVCQVPGCGVRYARDYKMGKHMVHVHKQSSESLRRSMMNPNAMYMTFPPCPYFGCTSGVFSHPLEYNLHIGSHYRRLVFCSEANCDATSSIKGYLKHRQSAHGLNGNSYKCHPCKDSFASITAYSFHLVAWHSPGEEFVCALVGCGVKFKTPTEMDDHMRICHDYHCPELNCGARFAAKARLTKHMSVEHGHKRLTRHLSVPPVHKRSDNVAKGDRNPPPLTDRMTLLETPRGISGEGQILAHSEHEINKNKAIGNPRATQVQPIQGVVQSQPARLSRFGVPPDWAKNPPSSVLNQGQDPTHGRNQEQFMGVTRNRNNQGQANGHFRLEMAQNQPAIDPNFGLNLNRAVNHSRFGEDQGHVASNSNYGLNPGQATGDPNFRSNQGQAMNNARPDYGMVVMYRCPYFACSATFESSELLDKHIVVHYRRWVYCGQPRCGEIVDVEKYIAHNAKVHAGAGGLRCRSCNMLFRSVDALKQHQNRIHRKELYEEACALTGCTVPSAKDASISEHMRLYHDFVCPADSCNGRFTSDKLYHAHVRRLHPEYIWNADRR